MASDQTPTQEAKGIASGQIQAYLDSGQPSEDCMATGGVGACNGDRTCRRCSAIHAALTRLQHRLEAQAYG